MLQHRAVVETELLSAQAHFIRIVDVLESQTADFSDALDCIDASLRWLDKLADESLYQPEVENINFRDPRQEGLQRAQTLLKQTVGNGAAHFLLQHVQTQLEDLLELVSHLQLELGSVGSQNSALRKVKDFFGKQPQNV